MEKIKRGLRTPLVSVFTDYFRVSDMVAIESLILIHNSGYEFYSKKEFKKFLKKSWRRNGDPVNGN